MEKEIIIEFVDEDISKLLETEKKRRIKIKNKIENQSRQGIKRFCKVSGNETHKAPPLD